ncbi:MAG: DUF1192 domain-containing protein [Pseudomonadota bacterium]
MNDDELNEKPDMTLGFLAKQDLYGLSVGDLDERIASMKAEIERCETVKKKLGDQKSEAEKLFKI